MTPERWQQLKQIFQSVLERKPAERSAFLNEACAGDPALRNEVESLIASHDQAGDSIEAMAAEAATEMLENERAIVGRQIGHYQVLSRIGRGGMGEVFLAQDTRLGRKVALKLLRRDFTGNEERLRRFRQEAQAASALNHPNILTIHEIGQEGSLHFIATEYVEGKTLREALSGTRMSLGQVLDIAAQVASALAAAHNAGIIHRDIKPENIMLRSDGYVKVLDFGLAKLSDPKTAYSEAPTLVKVETEPGVVMGTFSYMSPEQARGLAVDARTDIWSLGVMIYEMVAGRQPFEGETSSDVMSLILQREPPPLAHSWPEVPGELERIVRKALHKDKEERYQTSKDLVIDLRTLRKSLELEAEMERSAPPMAVSPLTINQSAATTAQYTSSAEYIVEGLKRHKRIAVGAIALLLVASAVAAAAYLYSLRSGGATINSMAVLPFVNASDDPDTEYLSDGITESLINSLSQLPNMRMIARTSAQRYKGREMDPQTVARELGVEAILTGRIVRRGDQLAVSVELLDARDSRHIWGEQYNRRPSDILAVQQEIAREISERLRARLTGEERRLVTRNYTDNVQAYQLYLRGRHHWNRRNRDSVTQAIGHFQKAIDLDPNYALAYSGLADSYSLLVDIAAAPASEAGPRARAAALRALEIDDSLAEAHASLAMIYTRSWEWSEAEREYKRAIELNPNYASAHQWYGIWLEVMGRSDEAVGEHRRAQELDPLSSIISANLARIYMMRGEFDSAINEGRKIAELNPDSPPHGILGQIYLKQGRNEEAIAEFEKGARRNLNGPATLGYGYAVTGRRSEALAIVKELEDRYARGEMRAEWIAYVYAGLGNKDQAFAWLERAFQERSGTLQQALQIFSYFDKLRDDPRYADLLRRMGLPH